MHISATVTQALKQADEWPKTRAYQVSRHGRSPATPSEHGLKPYPVWTWAPSGIRLQLATPFRTRTSLSGPSGNRTPPIQRITCNGTSLQRGVAALRLVRGSLTVPRPFDRLRRAAQLPCTCERASEQSGPADSGAARARHQNRLHANRQESTECIKR